MTYEEIRATQEFGELMQSLSSMLFVVAVVGLLFLLITYLARKKRRMTPKGPSVSRTVFTESCFGMVYNNTEEDATSEHYAVVFNSKGEELCRYEEDEGQTILGFTAENNVLYMHTTDTDANGIKTNTRWMYMLDENEFVECE